MLEKIETAYLAVMRVIVLIAATGALVVCGIGTAFSAPILLRNLGVAPSKSEQEPINLATFVREKKITQTSETGAQVPEVTVILGNLAKASNIIPFPRIERHP